MIKVPEAWILHSIEALLSEELIEINPPVVVAILFVHPFHQLCCQLRGVYFVKRLRQRMEGGP